MSSDLYRLIPEEGKHLAESRDTEGAYRGVYLDDETNKPSGAGEVIKVEDDESDVLSMNETEMERITILMGDSLINEGVFVPIKNEKINEIIQAKIDAAKGVVSGQITFGALEGNVNALQIDWESIVPRNKLDYIMGTPPFVGYSLQSRGQKQEI